jgi:transposase
MTSYAGLDVAEQETAICVISSAGEIVYEGRCATEPETIAAALRQQAPALERAVLETGALSGWLTQGLQAAGIPALCTCARQAHGVLKAKPRKSDRSDALMLARMAHAGLVTEVYTRTTQAHERKALVIARGRLVATRVAMTNAIRGHLKPFGIRLGRVRASAFEARVRELAAPLPILGAALEALLTIRARLGEQIAQLDRRLLALARDDAVCRRLMTIPGVGALVAQTFTAVIDDPARFQRSRDLGAYLGLVPRRYQSGATDVSGRISRTGDRTLRHLLYEAANNILAILKRPCALKTWATRLEQRQGAKKARTALARKLAILMHKLWISQRAFAWQGA